MNKIIELNSGKDGYKHFKLVMHEIYSEEYFDDVKQIAAKTNRNGIAWRRKWAEAHLDSIKDTSIRVEFVDDYDKTEIMGHGETGYGADNLPEFENAEVIGHFTGGYIDEIESDYGEMITVLVGEGYIDSMCNPRFVEVLENKYETGESVRGSVEIIKPPGQDSIIYEYDHPTMEMRVPKDYVYSGYAFLSVLPADDNAVLLELNSNQEKEETVMDINDIKTIVEQTISAMNDTASEINQVKTDCENKIAEANAEVEKINVEKAEAISDAEEKANELEACKEELAQAQQNVEDLKAEVEALKTELEEAKAKEKINDLLAAIAQFTDEEKAFAETEIDAFKENPITGEINSIVNKIYETIGKNAKAAAEKQVDEINAAKDSIEDIFGEVNMAGDADDTDIFA